MEETTNVNAQADIGDADDKWKDLKEIILKSAGNNIGYIKGRRPTKQLITDGMIKKIDERRKWKNVKTQVRRETDKAREDWWREQCKELEEMDKKEEGQT